MDAYSNPSGMDCHGSPSEFIKCQVQFAENSEITLTAITTTGDLEGWYGNCVAADDPNYPYHLGTTITFTVVGNMSCYGGY